jgi:hypothetical protein
MITKARAIKAAVLGAALSVIMAVPAMATPENPVKTAVTPEFTSLKNLALDMIPLALAVIAVAVGFRLAIGWFRRSRG